MFGFSPGNTGKKPNPLQHHSEIEQQWLYRRLSISGFIRDCATTALSRIEQIGIKEIHNIARMLQEHCGRPCGVEPCALLIRGDCLCASLSHPEPFTFFGQHKGLLYIAERRILLHLLHRLERLLALIGGNNLLYILNSQHKFVLSYLVLQSY